MNLALRQIDKRFGETVALEDVSVTLEAGGTLALIGTSGCGKSTLLRVLIGLVAPDRGEVLMDGEPLRAGAFRELRLRTGYVIQSGGLFPHMSARDNVVLMAQQLDWAADRTEQRLQELLRITRLPQQTLDRPPSALSGGQRQRVSLMRALMLDPDLLLLDEPLGALDPITRRELQVELKDIFDELGKTVVLVTHDMHEANHFADQLMMLHDGRCLQQGTLSQLLSAPADVYVTRFIQAQNHAPLDQT